MSMQFTRAKRTNSRLRVALSGPSGSGKTYSAILLALGLGGKVAMIDTEHGSADMYEHLGEYDTLQLAAPYTVAKYLEAIKLAESSGYSVIVIDSLSHAWAGDGGLLDKQGKLSERSGANSYTAWRTITPEHNALVEAILQSPAHVIACMRTKTEYVIETNEKGKQAPRKVGLAPVQRDGIEYEFTMCFDVGMDNCVQASKDRTGVAGNAIFKISKEFGATLAGWIDSGAAMTPIVSPKAPTPPAKTEGLPPCEAWETLYPQWADLVLSGKKNGPKLCAQIHTLFTFTPEQEAALNDLAAAPVTP
jgi:hypothetical protein